MKPPPLSILRTFAAAAVALAVDGAHAQIWPAKPVRLLVTSTAGTAPDIAARLLAERLSSGWGQQMVVENRGGAGGVVGMSAFVKMPPDGYSFALVQATVVTLTPLVYKEPRFDLDTDVVPVSVVATGPFIVAVNPGLGINTLAELVEAAKAKPGAINFAPPQVNGAPHLAGEMLARAAGVQFRAVPYNGTVPAVTATITNESQFTIDGIPGLAASIRSGKLKALAVTSRERVRGFESVPPVADTYKDFSAIGWFAVLAPAKTPAEAIERMNRDINAAMSVPEVVARFAEFGLYPRPGTQKDAIEFFARERAIWSKVVKEVGVQPQ